MSFSFRIAAAAAGGGVGSAVAAAVAIVITDDYVAKFVEVRCFANGDYLWLLQQ